MSIPHFEQRQTSCRFKSKRVKKRCDGGKGAELEPCDEVSAGELPQPQTSLTGRFAPIAQRVVPRCSYASNPRGKQNENGVRLDSVFILAPPAGLEPATS